MGDPRENKGDDSGDFRQGSRVILADERHEWEYEKPTKRRCVFCREKQEKPWKQYKEQACPSR